MLKALPFLLIYIVGFTDLHAAAAETKDTPVAASKHTNLLTFASMSQLVPIIRDCIKAHLKTTGIGEIDEKAVASFFKHVGVAFDVDETLGCYIGEHKQTKLHLLSSPDLLRTYKEQAKAAGIPCEDSGSQMGSLHEFHSGVYKSGQTSFEFIDPELPSAIEALRKLGAHVMLCSGKPLTKSKKTVVDKLGFSTTLEDGRLSCPRFKISHAIDKTKAVHEYYRDAKLLDTLKLVFLVDNSLLVLLGVTEMRGGSQIAGPSQKEGALYYMPGFIQNAVQVFPDKSVIGLHYTRFGDILSSSEGQMRLMLEYLFLAGQITAAELNTCPLPGQLARKL